MIIIGSRALFTRFENADSIERLQKADYDVIMSFEDFNQWYSKFEDKIIDLVPRSENKYNVKIMNGDKRVQYEIELDLENSSSHYLLNNESEVTDGNYVDPFGITWSTLSLPYLMLMKKSHLYFPVHFEKNINDYHFLKTILGQVELNESMSNFYKLRKNEAEVRFKDKHSTPSLQMSNDEFFKVSGKAEGRVYVHDDLHELVKHFDKPIYEMLKYEDKFESAWCEKDLFFELPFDYQIKCVQEETYVIALERYIIPKIGEYEDLLWCYKRALMRVCTTLCSGFFREFAIENYKTIVESYSDEFYKKLLYAQKHNLITPMEGRKVA